MSEESNELNGCQHVDRVFFREERVGRIHVRRVQSISNRRTVSKGFDRWLSAAECWVPLLTLVSSLLPTTCTNIQFSSRNGTTRALTNQPSRAGIYGSPGPRNG